MNNKTTHAIVNGDSRSMNLVKDESVQLIITSPPYWQLKDYGSENQIGFNDSYEDYINNLNLVWKECYRVLSKGCRLCINIGDQFARSVYYGRYKVIPIHSEIIRFCETLGFDFMGQIIWQKTTTTHTTGGGAVMGSFPCPRNGIVKLDFEYILLFKKQGNAPKPTAEQKEQSKMTTEEWNTYFNGHWNFCGAKQDKHLAMFPEELPYRLIRMFSFPNEIVLDPFAGSGTTLKVARSLGRNSVGYEVNPEFIQIMKDKIGQPGLTSDVRVFNDSTSSCEIISEKIIDLPYQFFDVHKLDKKVDVKKLQYGSKIDSESSSERQELYAVRRVISPELVELNNDIVVRLIGIRQIPDTAKNAVEFLQSKFNKRRVFLRHDDTKYDSQNNLLAYVYLDNKTFVNNHLLRTHLVDVDTSYEYSLQAKFLKTVQG